MSTKGIRRMLIGDTMPDKDDPKYKDRYQREVTAGRRFARAAKLDRLAADVQAFANGHRKTFLAIVFSLVTLSFSLNIVQLVRICHKQNTHQQPASAIKHQEHLLNATTHITPTPHEHNRQD